MSKPNINRKRLNLEQVQKLIVENQGPIGLDLTNKDLSGLDFQGLDLRGVIFSDRYKISDLSYCDFTRANLENAVFYNAICVRTHFVKANLKYADFRLAQIEDAYFRAAELQSADFYRAKILGRTIFLEANMYGASLYLAELSGAIINAEAIGHHIFQEDPQMFENYHRLHKRVSDERYLELEAVRYLEAKEVYSSLKARWLEEGRNSAASWAYFKERQNGMCQER